MDSKKSEMIGMAKAHGVKQVSEPSRLQGLQEAARAYNDLNRTGFVNIARIRRIRNLLSIYGSGDRAMESADRMLSWLQSKNQNHADSVEITGSMRTAALSVLRDVIMPELRKPKTPDHGLRSSGKSAKAQTTEDRLLDFQSEVRNFMRTANAENMQRKMNALNIMWKGMSQNDPAIGAIPQGAQILRLTTWGPTLLKESSPGNIGHQILSVVASVIRGQRKSAKAQKDAVGQYAGKIKQIRASALENANSAVREIQRITTSLDAKVAKRDLEEALKHVNMIVDLFNRAMGKSAEARGVKKSDSEY